MVRHTAEPVITSPSDESRDESWAIREVTFISCFLLMDVQAIHLQLNLVITLK